MARPTETASPPSQSAAARGRDRLSAWKAEAPGNAYSDDTNLTEVLAQRLSPELFRLREPTWRRFGAAAAGVIDEAVRSMERRESLPRLRRYDAIGRRIEAIDLDPLIAEIGAHILEAEMMADYAEPGREAAQLVIQYLLCTNGEAGHACPLACAAGLIKMLQGPASEELRARLLPKLLSTDPAVAWRASQFLTEVQGGSDVGANAVVAQMQPDGSARIHGEKWFCSVADADCFLMTARPEGAPEGTRGLAAFAVPRILDDGQPNAFTLRRLKDKLGTRLMASAEIDFEGALAWPIGRLDEGFKTIIQVVLTTSRLYNAVSCAGLMRRAEVEAFGFARQREAFGRSILQFPLVQRALARIKCVARASVASSFALAALADRRQLSGLSEADEAAYRALVVMNKLLTAEQATATVHEAMEIMGGNGAIEEFSPLPRLYRDAYVLEAWEGTHNVLAAQLARDFGRYRIHEGWLSWCEARLAEQAGSADAPATAASAAALRRALDDELKPSLDALLRASPAAQSVGIRDWAERAMVLSQGLCLLEEARWAARHRPESEKPLVLAGFVSLHGLGEAPTYASRAPRDEQLALYAALSGASRARSQS